MKQFKHKNYGHYHTSQVDTNHKKSENIWVKKDDLKLITASILESLDRTPQFGICHGVRTGAENITLSKLLGAEVVGTDLVGRNNVIKMDFHDEAPQWEGKADFIYTNSLDHSYDPDLAIRQWKKCLRPGGIILIHWDPGDGIPKPTASDCFRASANEYRAMLSKHGRLKEKNTLRYRPKKRKTIGIILFILTPTIE